MATAKDIYISFLQLAELEDRNKEVKQYKEQVDTLKDQVGLHIITSVCLGIVISLACASRNNNLNQF